MGRHDSTTTILYRSVPPRPYSYTFSDVLKTSLEIRTPGSRRQQQQAASSTRSKTAPVTSCSPEEYAERFKSRPTTRPAVIDLGCGGVRMYAGSGAVCRFNKPGFPAVRTARNPGHPASSSLSSSSLVGKALKGSTSSEPLAAFPLTERGTASTTTTTTTLHLAPLTSGPDPDPADPAPATDSLCPIHPPQRKTKAVNATVTTTTTTTRTHTPDVSAGKGRSSAASYRSRGVSPHHHHHHTHHQHQQLGEGERPQGQSKLTSGGSTEACQELSSSKLSTLDAQAFTQPSPGEQSGYARALAHSEDYADLSELPKPKRILPRRDLPWVFRFKVKKELNALSQIMASKPPGSTPAAAAVGPST